MKFDVYQVPAGSVYPREQIVFNEHIEDICMKLGINLDEFENGVDGKIVREIYIIEPTSEWYTKLESMAWESKLNKIRASGLSGGCIKKEIAKTIADMLDTSVNNVTRQLSNALKKLEKTEFQSLLTELYKIKQRNGVEEIEIDIDIEMEVA